MKLRRGSRPLSANCSAPLSHVIAGARGAISGLMGEVVEHHIRYHLVDHLKHPDALNPDAQEALIDVIHTYVKK